MGLVVFKPSEGKAGTFSVTTPSPVGVTAPEGFTIRLRDPGRDDRESGRPGGGSMGGPDGRLGWNGLVSSSKAER